MQKLSSLLILPLFLLLSPMLNAQISEPSDTLSGSLRLLVPNNYEAGWRKSFDLELFGAGMQAAYFDGKRTSLGFGGGIGMGLTSFMVLAGETFAGKYGISHEPRRFVKRSKVTIEYFNAKAFVQRNSNAGDFEFGLRYAYTVLVDDGGANGHFLGVYMQPMFGERRVQYGLRLNIGVYKAYDIDTEFGISFNPLIIRINPFREKGKREYKKIPKRKFIYMEDQ